MSDLSHIPVMLDEVIEGRRDIRRYRPDPVPDELVTQVVRAGHLGPSVGTTRRMAHYPADVVATLALLAGHPR